MSSTAAIDRRETPLLAELRDRIRQAPGGVLPVRDYMQACVARYYAGGDVLGRSGDFVTAPEISQIFGELLGLWCAVVWQQMGRPAAFHLVEFGPGRGTMMRDALRALRLVPDCRVAARVVLVETSPALRALQAQTLSDWAGPLDWTSDIESLAQLPVIAIGNEYVDALPIEQWQRVGGSWQPRGVVLDGAGHLVFASGKPLGRGLVDAISARTLDVISRQAGDNDVLELRALSAELRSLAQRRAQPTALLLIDYGHAHSGLGDTLQAVRRHSFEHPLQAPGEADLTAQVDFEVLAAQLTALGLTVAPPRQQSAFLAELGISERAARLMSANPLEANAIEMAVGRLLSPSGMGSRFLVLGAGSPGLPPLPGLPHLPASVA